MGNANRFVKESIRLLPNYQFSNKPFRIKLDQNENPIDLPDNLKQEVFQKLQETSWSRYPEDVPAHLLQKLAEYSGVTPDHLLLGNGISGLLMTVGTAILRPDSKVLIPKNNFHLYKHVCQCLGAKVLEGTPRSDYAPNISEAIQLAAGERPSLVILSVPNNPTGHSIGRSELQLILDSSPGLVVIDQAYWEFSGQNYLDMLTHYDNLLFLRTFSKAIHLAGGRLGYAIGRPELIRELRKARMPFENNIFALVAADVLLSHQDWLQQSLQVIIQERQRVYYELVMMPHVRPHPTQANFIMIQTERDNHEIIAFLNKYGIRVADLMTEYQIPNAIRVTISTPEENDLFLDALYAATENQQPS